MKAFSFRLHKLLRIRAAAEREQGRRLGTALQLEAEARRAVENEQERLRLAAGEMEEAARGAARAGTLKNIGTALEVLRLRAEKAAARHREALERLNEEREAYNMVRKERRILERLRDKMRESWHIELSLTEQKQLDEIAGTMNRNPGRGRK